MCVSCMLDLSPQREIGLCGHAVDHSSSHIVAFWSYFVVFGSCPSVDVSQRCDLGSRMFAEHGF